MAEVSETALSSWRMWAKLMPSMFYIEGIHLYCSFLLTQPLPKKIRALLYFFKNLVSVPKVLLEHDDALCVVDPGRGVEVGVCGRPGELCALVGADGVLP